MNHAIHGRSPLHAERGFTLIELMVGVLLGLLTTVIISQVMAVSEGQKRSTTSGTDAQVNGALATYTLERDLRMAGYGLMANGNAAGCEVHYGNASGTGKFTLAPVIISDGEDGAPDEVTIIASNNDALAVPMRVKGNHSAGGTYFTVESSIGVEKEDWLMAIPTDVSSTTCAVYRVTSKEGGSVEEVLSATTIPHDAAVSGVEPATGYKADLSYLVNVGTLSHRTYAVSDESLTVSALLLNTGALSAAETLYSHVVDLQAYYGKDTTGDGVVDSFDAVTPASATEWEQVRAVRFVVVTRSAERQKDDVTFAEPKWDVGTGAAVAGATTCGSSSCITLKASKLGNDWKRYSYKIYDTIVPLRNAVWNDAT